MSKKHTDVLPIRQHLSRRAKEKANSEIEKYFKPHRTLDVILEDGQVPVKVPAKVPAKVSAKVSAKKQSKDKNNNKKKNSKRSFSEFSTEHDQTDEKESISDAKRKKDSLTQLKSSKIDDEKISSTPTKVKITIENGPSATDRITRAPSCSSSDLDIVLDTSATSDSVIIVDSSAAVNETNGFDALHTEDPTESESDDRFNRPYWSLFTNRNAIVLDQAVVQSNVIDIFFGSKIESLKSSDIFPDSKPIVRRRSTAVWNTPPRYSMLPKY